MFTSGEDDDPNEGKLEVRITSPELFHLLHFTSRTIDETAPEDILTSYLELSLFGSSSSPLIEDFGVAKTEKDIGFYAGFVGCSFMLGRKPIILFGNYLNVSTAWGIGLIIGPALRGFLAQINRGKLTRDLQRCASRAVRRDSTG